MMMKHAILALAVLGAVSAVHRHSANLTRFAAFTSTEIIVVNGESFAACPSTEVGDPDGSHKKMGKFQGIGYEIDQFIEQSEEFFVQAQEGAEAAAKKVAEKAKKAGREIAKKGENALYSIGGFFSKAGSAIAAGAKAVGKAAQGVVEDAAEFSKDLFNNIKDGARKVAARVGQKFEDAKKRAAKLAKEVSDAVKACNADKKKCLSAAAQKAKQYAVAAANRAVSVAKTVGAKLRAHTTEMAEAVGAIVAKGCAVVGSGVDKAMKKLRKAAGAASAFMQGTWAAAQKKIEELRKKAGAAGKVAAAEIRKAAKAAMEEFAQKYADGKQAIEDMKADLNAWMARQKKLREEQAKIQAEKDKKRAAENAKKLAAIKAELAELAGKIKDVTVDIKNGALAAAKKVADAFHDWLNPEKPEIPQAVTDQAQIAYNAVIKGYGIGAEQK